MSFTRTSTQRELGVAHAYSERHGDLARVEVRRGSVLASGIGRQLLVQREQRRVAAGHSLPSQPVEHVLLWITKLSGGDEQYSSEISEVEFRRAGG